MSKTKKVLLLGECSAMEERGKVGVLFLLLSKKTNC